MLSTDQPLEEVEVPQRPNRLGRRGGKMRGTERRTWGPEYRGNRTQAKAGRRAATKRARASRKLNR